MTPGKDRITSVFAKEYPIGVRWLASDLTGETGLNSPAGSWPILGDQRQQRVPMPSTAR
jgi:hypothetical protein